MEVTNTDDRFLGMTEKDVEQLCSQLNLSIRLAEKDGEHFVLTADIDPSRVNFIINNGIVTRTWRG